MRRLSVVIAMASLSLSACGGGTEPHQPATGIYRLQAVGGAALPYTFTPAYVPFGDSSRALSGTLMISGSAAALSYTATEIVETYYSGIYAPPASSIDTLRGEGTFSLVGDSLLVMNGGGFIGDGLVSGSTITMQWEGSEALYVYRHQ